MTKAASDGGNANKKIVDLLVMGIGTIGEPLARLLLTHRTEFGIGKIYFAKSRPSNASTIKLLCDLGGELVVWAEKLSQFEEVLPQYGLRAAGTIEKVLETVDIVVDCTSQGNALKEKYYSRSAGPIGFLAQGSEEGFGHPFAFGVNDETLKPDEHRFVQIVSCNTHNILAVLRMAGKTGGEILAADFVLMRRMNDIGQSSKAIPAPSVDPVKRDKFPGYGSHQAFDAARVMRTLGIEMEGRLHSTAMKMNNQFMHLNRFRVKVKEKVDLEQVMKAAMDDPLMCMSHLRDMNLVFSKGRDYGFAGRIINQAVLIRDSLEVSPDGSEIYGVCFTPQDGNSLTSSVAAVLWFIDPATYKQKLKAIFPYLDRFHILYS